ncbi:MAG: hypothetical protein IKH57_11565, partial [Clostridia bacterium]|nr:hypothetical protein [Clostridia bacterium]
MKRLICVVLVLVFLLEASPNEALAESAGMITAEELAEAWALTGLDENAASYHSGMEADGAMNAMQLAGWVDDLLDNEMNTLGNIHADLEQAIAELQVRDDDSYQRLILSNEGQSYLNRSRELYAASEDLREQLRWHKDQLENKSGRIRYMIESLSEGQLTKAQMLRYSEDIREYARNIREIRSEISSQADTWDTMITNWDRILNGRSNTNDAIDAGMGEWISRLQNAAAGSARVSSVRASTLNPDSGKTLLSRISPLHSALAEDEEKINVIVMDDSVFLIRLLDGDKPVANATLTLRDQLKAEKDRVDIKATTDQYGNAQFLTKDFIQQDDNIMTVSMHAEIPDHRELYVSELDLARGETYNLLTNADIKHPYIKAMEFNGHDILLSEWQAFYSSQNDMPHKIKITVHHTAPVKLTMNYTGPFDVKGTKSITLDKPADGKTTTDVVWEDTWKNIFQPGKNVEFVISEDSGYSETVISKLTMVKGPFERPYLDEDNKLLETLTGDMGFGFTIPEKAGKPWAGSTLSLENIPILEKYMPHASVDIDGSVMVSIGRKPDDMSKEWKTKDQKDYDRYVKNQEKEGGWKVNKIAGGMCDMIDTHPKAFMGTAQADIGFYATLFARWPKDEDGRYDIHLDGAVGAVFTFGAEFTYYEGMFFVSAGVTASLALGFGLGVEIVSDAKLKPQSFNIDFGASGFTIMIRLTVTVSLGLGVKGVASISIVGSASFNIVIMLTLNPTCSVSFDADVKLVFQILWVKYEISLWNYNKQIYPSEKASVNLLSAMMARRANAEEDPQKGEYGSMPLSIESFPELQADLTKVSEFQQLNNQARFLNMNGVPFMLYIKKSRIPWFSGDYLDCSNVEWMNLTSGETGSFDQFVRMQGPEWGLTVAPPFEYAFDARSMEGDAGKALLAVALTTELVVKTYTLEDGTAINYSMPSGKTVAYIMAIAEKDGKLIPAEGDEKLPSFYGFNVQEQFGFACDEVRIADFRVVEDRAECSVSMQEYLDYDQNEITTPRRIGVVSISRANESDVTIQYHKDENRAAPKQGTTRTAQLSSMPYTSVEDGRRQIYTPVYSLEIDPQRADTRTMTVDGAKSERVEINSGNIVYYDMLSDKDIYYDDGRQNGTVTDWLFYLEREDVGDGNVRTVLKGLKNTTRYRWIYFPMADWGFVSDFILIGSDFDIAVSTPRFDIQKIYNTIYLYWLENGAKEKPDDPDTTRLSGIVFDPASNLCMGKYVLAEFESSQFSGDPSKVFLGADNKGYFFTSDGKENGTTTLYSFPLTIVPQIEISSAILDNNVVKPGAFLDINLGFTNKGSAPIGVFDVKAMLGENDVFETMRVDTDHPEKCGITMQDGTSIALSGEHTFYRLEESSEPMVQREWLVNRVSYRAYEGGIYDRQEYADHVKTNMIMPGGFAAYKTALKIPGSWEGGGKEINLQCTGIAVQRNYIRAAALNNGVSMDTALPNENDGSLDQIVYALNIRGDALERVSADTAADGTLPYANWIAGVKPVQLNHDIHEIQVRYRVYDGADGNERISITIQNMAQIYENLRLYAEIYPDDAKEPFYLNLPYDANSTSHGKTQTIDMAMSALLGGRKCRKLLVAVKAVGEKETAMRDNEFVLYFNDDDINDPLRFILQPADRLAMVGDTVVFTVAVAGGYPPYTYQWQVNRGLGMSWEDIAGATDEKLTVKDVTE